MAPEATSALTATLFVVMGVSGSGKTTIGTALAQQLGLQFADADDFHSEANKQKMAAGHPLTDTDREPWLEALNHLLLGWKAASQGGVLACSALKQSYRGTLSYGLQPGDVRWILLDLPRELLEQRLRARHHEFMNPSLLDSQFATLEQPADAYTLKVLNDRAPAEVVTSIVAQLNSPAKDPH